MSFVSVAFILFVAVTVLVYFLVPKRGQWIVLLAASYIYFFVNSEWLFLVLLLTTAVTWLTGRWVGAINQKGKQFLKDNGAGMSREEKKAAKLKTKKSARRVMLLGIAVDLGLLLFLKYYNFFARNINSLLALAVDWRCPSLGLLLPIGISYYTLQAMAYIIDIYRNKYEPDKNFFQFMLFMSYFPQIVQGPIARYDQLAGQLTAPHDFDYTRASRGVQLALWGMMKKLIIADRIAIPVSAVFDHYTQYSGLLLFLAAAGYSIQIYTDFSGGMDIARGVSQIFGLELELNFNQPFFSRSVEEFWRRWHITLGGWMRDYIFYPLSLSKAFGNLSKKSRKLLGAFIGKRLPPFLAMFVVYFLVGFWHGPEWKYVGYGVWNGLFIMSGILLTETYDKGKALCGIDGESAGWRVFQMVRTFCICSAGRFFVGATGLRAALSMMKRVTYRWYDLSFLLDKTLLKLGLDTANWILLAAAVGVMFFVDLLHERNVPIRESIAKQHVIFRWLIYYAAIVAVIVFGIYGPDYNSASFIYEQF